MDTYYHGIIRKHLILFGALLNSIYIERVDANDEVQKKIKVPLSYGPKEWYLARYNDNKNLTKPVNKILPRVAYELVSFRYAAERKMNTTNRNVKNTDLSTSRQHIMEPVPYDLHIRVQVMTRNADDGTRIVEQIIPRFTPELTLTLKSIPGLDIVNDVPIVLGSVQLDDDYEGNMSDDDRVVIWNLDFVMKASFYGPIGEAKVIKEIDLNLYDDLDSNDFIERIRIRPGLTADGYPTSNSALSVPHTLINADDNYGFIVEYLGGEYTGSEGSSGSSGEAPTNNGGNGGNDYTAAGGLNQYATLGAVIGGFDIEIPTSSYIDIAVPFKCRILSAMVLANGSGNLEVDVLKTTFDSFSATVPNTSHSIVGGAYPAVVNDVKYYDETLYGWDKEIDEENAVLRIIVRSVDTIEQATVSLRVLKANET